MTLQAVNRRDPCGYLVLDCASPRERATAPGALASGLVLCHPFVIGELACGNLQDRHETLNILGELPAAPVASHTEALTFLHRHELQGRGMGWIDTHLLASAALAGASVWTLDPRMSSAAASIGLLR